MRAGLAGAVVAAAMLVTAAPTQSAMTVIGSGQARECYLAAELETGSRIRDGLDICSRALLEEALTQRDRAATLVNRGILNMRGKAIDAAIRDYDAALRAQPGLAEAFVNKGIALLHKGDEAAAVEMLTAGIDRSPARPEVAYYSRGVAHELLGKLKEAMGDYRQAATLAPKWDEPVKQLERFKVVSTETKAG